jgi:hypothetical protein
VVSLRGSFIPLSATTGQKQEQQGNRNDSALHEELTTEVKQTNSQTGSHLERKRTVRNEGCQSAIAVEITGF